MSTHPSSTPQPESPDSLAADIEAVGRIGAVPTLLKVVCETTGMGFAAVARVSSQTWTACAVRDTVAFGLKPGGQLELTTTLCHEVRGSRAPIAIDQASTDPGYSSHHTPRIYGIESYISVPIVLPDGEYFGNLCAIDARPAQVKQPHIVSMFELFAEMIATQLHSERTRIAEQKILREEIAVGELREQFIAVLGHDLRNPLAAISMGVAVLEKKSSDPSLVAIANRVADNVRRMRGLLDHVLDFARGRLGGGIGVAIGPVADLAQAVTQVVDELRDANPARAVTLNLEPLPTVHCDAGRVQQLISNLLGNALAYGYSAHPVVVDVEAAGDTLCIDVTNQGDPISGDALRKVFSPFWRRSVDANRDGLGLGLHICSEIVKGHGGRIEARSSADRGTTFSVRLPVAGPGRP